MNTELIYQKIKDVWFGRELLWKVFWIYKFAIGGILGLLFEFINSNRMHIEATIILAIYTVFHIWVLKGLYACRFNMASPRFVAPIIPFFVGLNFVLLAFSLFQFFFPELLPQIPATTVTTSTSQAS